MTSVYELHARERKASMIADLLAAAWPELPEVERDRYAAASAWAASFDSEQRARAAVIAKQHVPSVETWRCVVALLERREDAARRVRRPEPADPFDGVDEAAHAHEIRRFV